MIELMKMVNIILVVILQYHNDEAGFNIDILKFNSKIAKDFYPYAARLFYGRYNFVKEEF